MFDFGSDDELCCPDGIVKEVLQQEPKVSCSARYRSRSTLSASTSAYLRQPSSDSDTSRVHAQRRAAVRNSPFDFDDLDNEDESSSSCNESSRSSSSGVTSPGEPRERISSGGAVQTGLNQSHPYIQDLVKEHRQEFAQMSLQTLKGVYSSIGLPCEPGMQKQDYLHRLTSIAKWQKMQLFGLHRECDRCGILTNGLSQAGSVTQQQQILAQRLCDKMCIDAWQSKGIPAQRLGCFQVAAEVVAGCARLADMSTQELQDEYRACGMPSEANIQRKDLLARCNTLLFWSKFPLQELLKECQIRKVPTSGVSKQSDSIELRQEILNLLLKDMCSGACTAKGIPVHRLTSVEVAAKLMDQLERLARLSNQSLHEECRSLGCPLEFGSDRKLLLDTLHKVLLWLELPVAELKKELQDRGMQGHDAEEHQVMVGQLLLTLDGNLHKVKGIPALRLGSNEMAAELLEEFQCLETASTANIQRRYGALGLPWDVESDRPAFVAHLKTVLVWGKLPTHELRKECRDRGVSTSCLACWGEDLEMRQTLVRRLELDLCADAYDAKGVPAKRLGSIEAAARVAREFSKLQDMSIEELRSEFAKENTAWPDDFEKHDAIACLKDLRIWKELPIAELHGECHRRGVPTNLARALGGAGEMEQRRRLAHRLFQARCEREEEYEPSSHYEAMGIPVKQIGSLRLAAQIAEEFKNINSLSVEELRCELKKYGPDWVNVEKMELVSHVKYIAVWTKLPLDSLRADCRSRHVPFSTGDAEHDLVRRLVFACHAYHKPRQPRTQAQWRQAAPPGQHAEPLSPRTESSFAALSLPPNASSVDVGRAFRRLALKFHPDKNSGEHQEATTAEFREIAEAYEVCSEYLKARGR